MDTFYIPHIQWFDVICLIISSKSAYLVSIVTFVTIASFTLSISNVPEVLYVNKYVPAHSHCSLRFVYCFLDVTCYLFSHLPEKSVQKDKYTHIFMYLLPDIYVLFDLYCFVCACVHAVVLIYSLYKERNTSKYLHWATYFSGWHHTLPGDAFSNI